MGPYFPVPLGFGFSNVVAIVAAFVVVATTLGASVVSTMLPLATRAADLVRHLILRLGVVDVLAVLLDATQAALSFGGMRHGGRSFDVERRCKANIVDFYNYSRLQRARTDAIIVFVDVSHRRPSVPNEETEK